MISSLSHFHTLLQPLPHSLSRSSSISIFDFTHSPLRRLSRVSMWNVGIRFSTKMPTVCLSMLLRVSMLGCQKLNVGKCVRALFFSEARRKRVTAVPEQCSTRASRGALILRKAKRTPRQISLLPSVYDRGRSSDNFENLARLIFQHFLSPNLPLYETSFGLNSM